MVLLAAGSHDLPRATALELSGRLRPSALARPATHGRPAVLYGCSQRPRRRELARLNLRLGRPRRTAASISRSVSGRSARCSCGGLWICFSLWLSRHWIETLAQAITLPLAFLLVAGVALIPGYLNIQLISAILIDRPRPLRFDMDFPAITLMVAAYNEEVAIAETLDYVMRSDYPGDFEVLVADDGSTDRTRDIVTEYALRHPSVRLVAAPHAG
jgi:Glycosyl transferase family 2